MTIPVPVSLVQQEEQPNNLLYNSDKEERHEEKPENDVDFLVENVDGENTESVVVDDCAAGSEQLERALGHLGEHGVDRADSPVALSRHVVHEEAGTVGEELALQVPVHSENVQDKVDKVHGVAQDQLGGPPTVAAEEVLKTG